MFARNWTHFASAILTASLLAGCGNLAPVAGGGMIRAIGTAGESLLTQEVLKPGLLVLDAGQVEGPGQLALAMELDAPAYAIQALPANTEKVSVSITTSKSATYPREIARGDFVSGKVELKVTGLPVGSTKIAIAALDKAGMAIAEGSATAEIKAGVTVPVAIVLSTKAASGSVSISVDSVEVQPQVEFSIPNGIGMATFVQKLQQDFGNLAGANGVLTYGEILRGVPESAERAEFLSLYHTMLFASIDSGSGVWWSLTSTDVGAIGSALAQNPSKPFTTFAEELASKLNTERGIGDRNRDGRSGSADIQLYVEDVWAQAGLKAPHLGN